MHHLKLASRQSLYRSNNNQICKTMSLFEAQLWSQNSLNFLTASNKWGTLKIIQIKVLFYTQWCTDCRRSSYSANGKQTTKQLSESRDSGPSRHTIQNKRISSIPGSGSDMCLHFSCTYVTFCCAQPLALKQPIRGFLTVSRRKDRWCQAPAWTEESRPPHRL